MAKDQGREKVVEEENVSFVASRGVSRKPIPL